MRRLDPETYTWPEIEVLSGASLVHAWLRGDGGFLSSLLPLFVLFYFYIYGYKNDETSSRAPAGGKLLARSDESCEGGEKGAGEDLRIGATFVWVEKNKGTAPIRFASPSGPLARPMQIVNSKFYNLGLHVLFVQFSSTNYVPVDHPASWRLKMWRAGKRRRHEFRRFYTISKRGMKFRRFSGYTFSKEKRHEIRTDFNIKHFSRNAKGIILRFCRL